MSDLWVLDSEIDYGAVQVERLVGFEETWLLDEGEPLSKAFPRSARLVTDGAPQTRPGPARGGKAATLPAGLSMPDLLRNGLQLLIVSEAMGATLAAAEPKLELLPIEVTTPKKLSLGRYALAHTLDPVDAFDAEASKYSVRSEEPLQIHAIERLRLDASKVPADRMLFRLTVCPDVWIIRDELAKSLEAKDYTGMRLWPLDEYDQS